MTDAIISKRLKAGNMADTDIYLEIAAEERAERQMAVCEGMPRNLAWRTRLSPQDPRYLPEFEEKCCDRCGGTGLVTFLGRYGEDEEGLCDQCDGIGIVRTKPVCAGSSLKKKDS